MYMDDANGHTTFAFVFLSTVIPLARIAMFTEGPVGYRQTRLLAIASDSIYRKSFLYFFSSM